MQSNLFFYFQQGLRPVAYDLVVSTLKEITQNSGGAKLTFGLLFVLYSGSGGMTELISTLNAAYVPEGRSWLKVHTISLGLTVVMAVLIVTALLLVLAGGDLGEFVGQGLRISSVTLIVGKVLQWMLALAFVVLAFALIYYYAPDVKERHWYWITPGSA